MRYKMRYMIDDEERIETDIAPNKKKAEMWFEFIIERERERYPHSKVELISVEECERVFESFEYSSPGKEKEYYIGDPCYVLSDDIYYGIWCDKYNNKDGEFTDDFQYVMCLRDGSKFGNCDGPDFFIEASGECYYTKELFEVKAWRYIEPYHEEMSIEEMDSYIIKYCSDDLISQWFGSVKEDSKDLQQSFINIMKIVRQTCQDEWLRLDDKIVEIDKLLNEVNN